MCLKQWEQSSPCGNSLGHDGEAQDTGKKIVFPLPSLLLFCPHRNIFSSFKREKLQCSPHVKCSGPQFELTELLTLKQEIDQDLHHHLFYPIHLRPLIIQRTIITILVYSSSHNPNALLLFSPQTI